MPRPMPCLSATDINDAIRAVEIDYETSEEWGRIITKIITGKDNHLRATKPKSKTENMMTGKAAYVWRMVAFAISPRPQHQCMPCTADFSIPAYDETGKWSYAEVRKITIELDKLAEVIVGPIPVTQQAGTMRWGRALGF